MVGQWMLPRRSWEALWHGDHRLGPCVVEGGGRTGWVGEWLVGGWGGGCLCGRRAVGTMA